MTVFAGEAPHYVDNHHANDAAGVLRSVAAAIAGSGRLRGAAYVVVLCPEHVAVLARDGWGPDRAREYLAREATVSVADRRRTGRLPGDLEPGDEQELHRAIPGLAIRYSCSSPAAAPAASRPSSRPGPAAAAPPGDAGDRHVVL